MENRIIYVIGNLDVGGAERHLAQVLPMLVTLGVEPIVYTLSYKGKLATVLENAGVRVVEPLYAESIRLWPSFFRKLVLLPLSVFCLWVLLIRSRPSIVHFFLPAAYLLGALCSLVAGRHIRIMSRRSLNRYQLKHPALARIEHLLHRHMHAILGNSLAVTDELCSEGVPSSRLGLLYNGINLAAFDNLPLRATIRKKLGVSNDALLMVCVANLIPYKGHADLIHALGRVRSELPADWVIALVGRDAGIQADLQQLAEENGISGHILWLGERSDTAAIYSAADMGVLCSHEEGFSNSILEGMAAGVAMVVTNVGGNAEAVLHGQSGLVVPARNPALLGKAILQVAGDKEVRNRMAMVARKRVMEKFSLESCVRQYAGLYQALRLQPEMPVQQALDVAIKESS